MAPDNQFLGQFTLENLPLVEAGKCVMDVTFEVNENGILKVTAINKVKGSTNSITIKNEKGRLTNEEINEMVAEAALYREADKKARDNVLARNNLESLIQNVQRDMNDRRIRDYMTVS